MEAVVVADELQRSYGDTDALAGVSLSIGRGEVFALIGPNGAGKTTLVRALTGTTVPDGGSARVLGNSPETVDRDRLGVLPQDFSPPDRLTARELLAYYAGLYEEPRDPDAVLADVGLADAGDTWYENLSGGQQRRVCVGTTLVNDPDVLVLDEPTTGIDPAGRRTVWRLVESLADAGTTVLLTTHDMAEAQRLGDRVGLLADGELIAVGTPEELVTTHAGSSRLTVEIPTPDADTRADADPPTPVDPATFADLEYPIDVRTNAETSTVVVREISPTEIASVVTFLDEREIEYTELAWAEPDLEDVYLELADETEVARTGRAGGGTGATMAETEVADPNEGRESP
ncbi:ABC transporter ATP-binding protein [Halobacteria archaeon AArc-m2/3/4]|uniref:ABC transporter ATP-binding protein n=1 Tax=Natronoglomus mannanivorans TaxID=2979990 RepID=A0AAP3E0B6_9EURY|nr:ABC transporter ATP-binding protein [Halobacteria archaeon AArc-xg1-1]MCU4971686.1 ABC transporter ATP-binding protein [Halobacteria archaeon AArc-m2/3/4]